jgi:hypothetical protein
MFKAMLHGVDVRYKVGAEMDLLLEYRGGLRNANRCAEGLAPDDEYRIAEDRAAPSQMRQYRVELEPSWASSTVYRFGNIRVLQREGRTTGLQ